LPKLLGGLSYGCSSMRSRREVMPSLYCLPLEACKIKLHATAIEHHFLHKSTACREAVLFEIIVNIETPFPSQEVDFLLLGNVKLISGG